MKYWIDFSCWLVNAESEEAAVIRVKEIIADGAKAGKIPTISSVQESFEDHSDEDLIELEVI